MKQGRCEGKGGNWAQEKKKKETKRRKEEAPQPWHQSNNKMTNTKYRFFSPVELFGVFAERQGTERGVEEKGKGKVR